MNIFIVFIFRLVSDISYTGRTPYADRALSRFPHNPMGPVDRSGTRAQYHRREISNIITRNSEL